MHHIRFTLYLLTAWSSLSHALSGAQSLTELAAKDSFYEMLLDATVYVRMIDTDPFKERVEKDGTRVLEEQEFKQEGCTALYIQKPGYFLTSAACFADSEGRLDKFRRFATLFSNGERYEIDPISIVLHEKFKGGPSDNDLAVFALESNSAKKFEKAHTPIELIREHIWVTEGQTVTAVAFGSTGEKTGDFGVGYAKDFVQHYPDASDIQQAGGALALSQDEALLTYWTRNGEKGVNCTGDSGGGVFVRLNTGPGQKEIVYLQSVIIGKVGPDGDGDAACEEISRYLVGVDLRRYVSWVSNAIVKSETQLVEKSQLAAKASKEQEGLFGRAYGTGHLYLHSSELEELLQPYAALPKPQRFQKLWGIAQAYAGLDGMRERLVASHVDKTQPSAAKVLRIKEKDPYLYERWFTLSKSAESDGLYIPTKKTLSVSQLRFINTGNTTIKLESARIAEGPDKNPHVLAAQEIAPGGILHFTPTTGYLSQYFSGVTVNGLTKSDSLEIYAHWGAYPPAEDPLTVLSQSAKLGLAQDKSLLNEQEDWDRIVAKHQPAILAARKQLDALTLDREGKKGTPSFEARVSVLLATVEVLQTTIAVETLTHNRKYGSKRPAPLQD